MSASVDVAGALALLNRGADVIDVRRPAEFNRGHMLRARNLPLAELRPDDLRGRVVLCVCAHGLRSATACDRLRAAGIDAYVLTRGLAAWQASGQPLIALGGGPGDVD